MNFEANHFPCNCAVAINQSKKREVMCVICCEKHALELQPELVALARAMLRKQGLKETIEHR